MSDFDKDSDCIAHALNGWANHIETGNMVMSEADVMERIKSLLKEEQARGGRIDNSAVRKPLVAMMKDLDPNQKAFVARLREMAKKARGL